MSTNFTNRPWTLRAPWGGSPLGGEPCVWEGERERERERERDRDISPERESLKEPKTDSRSRGLGEISWGHLHRL